MSKKKDTDYAYAVAKVRAVENKLLDKQKLIRMAEVKTTDEAMKILRESGYEGNSPEQMLSDEAAKTYAFLKEISPSEEIFDIFSVKYDYHNVKVLLKAEFLGKNYDFLLTEKGRYSARLMKNLVENRQTKSLSPILHEATEQAFAMLEKTGDPQMCDILLDKAAYREMRGLAEQTGSSYICDMVSAMCDLANIRIFVRVRRMKRNADFLPQALLDGGTLSKDAFAKGQTLSEILSGTQYALLADFEGNISELEKQTDNFMLRFLKKAKYIAFGAEPLVAYLLAKENEIKQVRIILTGKKNGLSPEMITERLREVYV